MNVSASSAATQVDASAPQTVVMAKKALDAQKQEGEQAVALIQAATPPPVKQGHGLSVYA